MNVYQRRHLAPYAAALVLLALPAPRLLRAQAILGRVVDATSGQPLRKAAVGVQIVGHEVIKTLTANDGAFALLLPAPGRYVVRVQASLGPPVSSDSITVAADSTVQIELRFPMPPDPVFYDYQVEKPAAQIPGSSGPLYPVELKKEGVEGEVLVRFVVDTTGRVVPATFQVLRQTHKEFTESVRAALPNLRFVPAERQGARSPRSWSSQSVSRSSVGSSRVDLQACKLEYSIVSPK